MSGLTRLQRVGVILAAIFYVFAGSVHFAKPEMYTKIMPPYLPWHAQLVWISGFFEVLGGLGLLVQPVRRMAAWGLVALLVAVFPANIYMATNPAQVGMAAVSPILLWGRLPLQCLLIWWVLWCTKAKPTAR